MPIAPRFSRHLCLWLAAGTLGLGACKKDSTDAAAEAGDGSITWTNNGTTYTSTLTSGVIVDPTGKFFVMGSAADNNNVVMLTLRGIDTKGAGVYDLRQGSVLDDHSIGTITLNGTNPAQGTIFNTLYGPNASNGTVTITQYDKAAQKVSGTFAFTGTAIPYSPGSGNQTVTNGSFRFTKFH